MSHWKSAPYIAPASISGSLNLSGGFFGSSIRQSPNFPLKSIEFNEFKRKIEIIFSSFQYFSILFVYYTRWFEQKKKKKKKKDRRIFKNYLLDQICDESSATGWPSERERIHVRRHDEVTFVLVLRLASTDLHRVVGTTHPRINLPIPELLYFLPLTDQTRANPRWNGILFSFLLLLLNPSLLIATNRYPISLKIYILLLRKF